MPNIGKDIRWLSERTMDSRVPC